MADSNISMGNIEDEHRICYNVRKLGMCFNLFCTSIAEYLGWDSLK